MKWSIELAKFGLQFTPRHVIKSQALANFVVEWTLVPCLEEEAIQGSINTGDREPWMLEYWTMNFSGSLTLHVMGAGAILTSSTEKSSATQYSSTSGPPTTWWNTRASAWGSERLPAWGSSDYL